MKVFIALAICVMLAGCGSMPLKDGELYLNDKTSMTMDDFGVPVVKNRF